MSATIKCPDELKQSIINDLSGVPSNTNLSLIELLELINADETDVSIEETPEGLNIDFPGREIYGFTHWYVLAVTNVFSELKRKYPNIGIFGICCYYETVSGTTIGPLFHCEPSDKALRVVEKWQQCAGCGEVLETDTFYNSSRWDFGEGEEFCLCSPECMRAYLENGYTFILNTNHLWTEEQEEAYYDDKLTIEEFLEQMLESSELH